MNNKNHKKYSYNKKENGKNKVGRQEKYTEKFVEKELIEIEEYINSDDGSDIILLGEVCNLRGYSAQRWSEIIKKFENNQKISELIKRVENKLEHRLFKAGLLNQVNVTMAIFGLKNKYKWQDKQDLDHSSSDGSMTPKPTVINFTKSNNEQ